ncbi:MAG: adenylyl-sulfate kinase [Magnetovibrio sp.]|nr:adenylyl-sulfate kinase [Magnetovibrio sp.]
MKKQLYNIAPKARWIRQGHKSGVLWLTGLSGAGKSALAVGLERFLFDKGMRVFALDGDNLRHGLTGDLGFSHKDRHENIRRLAEVAAAFVDSGFIVVTAFISPFRVDRDNARRKLGGQFHEIFVKADLNVCEERDPKGLYARARAGEIKNFTGISSPYEEPYCPELILNTGEEEFESSLARLLDYALIAFADGS